MTHPFADYNKYQNQGVLVGNWVEEHALKTSTGTHRYEVRCGSCAAQELCL